VQEHFGFVPCNWQVQSAQAQLKQRDVVTLSPTGSGKTLTFWIPVADLAWKCNLFFFR
ncbi:hypothetical protein BDR06DRAFT_844982, partial [Suillus hirtellus]